MARDGGTGATKRGFAAGRAAGNRSCWGVLAAALASLAAGGRADEFAGEQPLAVRAAIGAGIHAFHSGDYARAHDELTNAIEAGSDDPTSYYFRGLAASRLGRTDEAVADFTTGADRESATGGTRRVSLALERVQGHDRLALERHRVRARLGALQREREASGRRYSGIEGAAGDVRRRRRPEDIRPELVAPRPLPEGDALPAPADAEEVPKEPSRPARPGKTFEDEPEEEMDDPFGASAPGGKSMKKPVESDDPFGN